MKKQNFAPQSSASKSGKRRTAWILLFLTVVTVLIAVALPVWIIQPFKAQSSRGLQTAFTLRDWSPLVSIIGLTLTLLLTVYLWKGTRWFVKPVFVIALVLTCAAAWFARQNHFEWIFNALPDPGFAIVEDASFVDDKDYVIAVELNGDPVAYPVRQLAYHHLVHDIVGGIPVVTTY
jgi:hypothetical protein